VAFFIAFMSRIRIVGGGLAGSILALQSLEKGYTVEWWKSGTPSSSIVAAGISNPLALKRLKFIQRADEFMSFSEEFYRDVERQSSQSFYHILPLYHILHTNGEVNDWQVKAESPLGEKYFGTVSNHSALRKSLGKLQNVGWLDTELFLDTASKISHPRLISEQRFWTESDLTDGIETVLCQGWKSVNLPFGIPSKSFNPAKGEVLLIASKSFPITDGILHGGIFVLPLGNHRFKIGSTYTWDELDELPSKSGRAFLVEEFEKMWDGEYAVIDHLAAVRPTTRDRKPLVGRIPGMENLSVFNGMGSRAVLMAPLLAVELLNHLFEEGGLTKELSPSRFLEK
jgi:glycine oxidase